AGHRGLSHRTDGCRAQRPQLRRADVGGCGRGSLTARHRQPRFTQQTGRRNLAGDRLCRWSGACRRAVGRSASRNRCAHPQADVGTWTGSAAGRAHAGFDLRGRHLQGMIDTSTCGIRPSDLPRHEKGRGNPAFFVEPTSIDPTQEIPYMVRRHYFPLLLLPSLFVSPWLAAQSPESLAMMEKLALFRFEELGNPQIKSDAVPPVLSSAERPHRMLIIPVQYANRAF